MQAEQIMEIDVSVLTGGSFHTPHIYLKEDRAKIAGAYLIIEVSEVVKEEARSITDNAIAK